MSWTLDKAHTSIGFTAKHMMFTTVRGQFTDYTADLNINPDNPQQSQLDVTIQLASVDTNEQRRDGHLRSGDFFDAENYPTMTFHSTSVEGSDPNHFKLHGDLTIKNVTRPIVLDVTKEGEAKSPFGGARLAAYTATATINRKDWGLNWNVALEAGGWLVSEQVKLVIESEVVEQAATAVAEEQAETNLTGQQAEAVAVA